MLNQQLIDPKSIVIIGASNNTHKPGGKILKNIVDGNFNGRLYTVNPHEFEIQGIKCYHDVHEIPLADLAILAIPAKSCLDAVKVLALEKNSKAFIIISAGFSEEGQEGRELEKKIVEIINDAGGVLLGPNCTGMLNINYCSIFTSPIPLINSMGCDLISGSGAVAAYIFESAIPKGLKFSSVFSVGNSAQIGIEEILEFMDVKFNIEKDTKIKLLYIENIKDPDKLLKHTSSLISKGCKIAAIKSGSTESGSRAAALHTGALASPDLAVEALFRKAGIVRCYSREELTTVASVFTQKEIKGKRIAIITHAGGPAVMLTDVLTQGGLEIPNIDNDYSKELMIRLLPGSSVSNPIDLLATGTAKHLELAIDYCDQKFNEIDAMFVIFGSPGLNNVFDAYDVLDRKMKTCKKPIYPILPSLSTAKEEVQFFLSKNHVNFPDEVMLADAIVKINNTPKPASEIILPEGIHISEIKRLATGASEGLASEQLIKSLFSASSIPLVKEIEVKNRKQLLKAAEELKYPLVLKVTGIIHKSEIGGVVVNIKTKTHLIHEFNRLMKLKGSKTVVVQPVLNGIELFIGAKYEPKFGHIIMCGLGGIFVELLNDISSGLAPLTFEEAISMIRSTKSYKLIKGFRGQKGLNENKFAEIIVRLSIMLRYATEIKELDINPLIGHDDEIYAVDVKMIIRKN